MPILALLYMPSGTDRVARNGMFIIVRNWSTVAGVKYAAEDAMIGSETETGQ